MTPEFANAVDPVFLHILGLLDRINRDEEVSATVERIQIIGLLDHAEALIGAGEEWELARYALVSWIDEVLVEAPWSGREWWSNNVLEMELFNSRACYEQFFVQAKTASALLERDAMEVFYVCVVLGFRGLYRDPEFASAVIQSHRLPPNLSAWAKQASISIRLGHGRPQLISPTRELAGAPPMRGKFSLVWAGLTLTLIAGLNVILFYTLYLSGSKP